MVTMTQTGSTNRKLSILFLFFIGILIATLFLSFIFTFKSSDSIISLSRSQSIDKCNCNANNPPRFDLESVSTFYDDHSFGYTFDKPVKNWDKKRLRWLKLHPSFSRSNKQIFLVTGSQSKPCKNPKGDHYLLRFYKNKVDYCRIHGYDIFYNNVLLEPKMSHCWAKLPAVRAAMVAHPEAEWIWWIDEDAVFTDIDYKVPLERYKDRNFIVHGWPREVYEEKNWLGINAGSFLIRNCQWSLDFLEKWADMGPQSKNREKWSKLLSETFNHEADDQTALAYLLLKDKEENESNKTYIEMEYYLEGYWAVIADTLKNITDRYNKIEKENKMLKRRHAELVTERYAELWEPYLKDAGSWRRPFVTHFAGCQPCSGHHNPSFSMLTCWKAMEKVLNYADNQVLRNYGFEHPDLSDSSLVSSLPF
ncbi:putative xyloglucan 6-xylosyltransferase [Helianthus debilis subsp. tardiflorus]